MVETIHITSYAVRTPSFLHSAMLQKLAFDCGYRWPQTGRKIHYKENFHWLVFYPGVKHIRYCSTEHQPTSYDDHFSECLEVVDAHRLKEIFNETRREMEIEHET